MDLGETLNLLVLIVVIYLAFRIGAVLMKILLGLLAIALVWWLVTDLGRVVGRVVLCRGHTGGVT